MGPEVLIVAAAAFISGGAIGSVGTLLAQWILNGVGSRPEHGRRVIDPVERDVLREEVAELHKHLRNMDARLDFTERLLDGAIPLAPPPARMPAPELRDPPSAGGGEGAGRAESRAPGSERKGPEATDAS